jgi:hypothetical protein
VASEVGAQDVNIWNESDDKNIVWDKNAPNTVKAASLNKLVELLTLAKDAGTAIALYLARGHAAAIELV